MRICIHTSFLVELRQEYCLTSVLGGLGGLRGDVTGVGNPSDVSKDPSADLGNLSGSFGASQECIWGNPVTHNKEAAWLQEIRAKENERMRRRFPESVRNQLMRIPNWKAPGPDEVHGYWLKNFRVLHQKLAEQLQHCINNHQAPEWMATGRTALVQKDKSKGNVASNYRPITCLPIMWKLLTGIINERLYNYL